MKQLTPTLAKKASSICVCWKQEPTGCHFTVNRRSVLGWRMRSVLLEVPSIQFLFWNCQCTRQGKTHERSLGVPQVLEAQQPSSLGAAEDPWETGVGPAFEKWD